MTSEGTTDSLMLEDESLRDGLQIESRIFSLEEKLHIFNLLSAAGIRRVQVGSFVNPQILPQMADTDELIRRIGLRENTEVSALVLNDKGLDRALSCGVQHVNMSVSISDTHSRKNTGRSASQSLRDMVTLIRRALAAGLRVRGGFQCVFGCDYEGAIAEEVVVSAVDQMAQSGVGEINLADTTGMATPAAIQRLVLRFRKVLPQIKISLHLHDTRGLALANLYSGYVAGVRSFDVCAGGLGGCPFVIGAAGNVSAEDAVNMFESMGIATGVDVEKLCAAVDFYEEKLGRQLPGRMNRVLKHANEGCERFH